MSEDPDLVPAFISPGYVIVSDEATGFARFPCIQCSRPFSEHRTSREDAANTRFTCPFL